MGRGSSSGGGLAVAPRVSRLGLAREAVSLFGAWGKGALFGLGLAAAAAALSHPINNELRWFSLLLEKLCEFYPVAAAGILIGGAIGVVWRQRGA